MEDLERLVDVAEQVVGVLGRELAERLDVRLGARRGKAPQEVQERFECVCRQLAYHDRSLPRRNSLSSAMVLWVFSDRTADRNEV